jgi:hypothetical protein
MVDDLLEEDDAEVNAAGYVGQELSDEVIDGCAGQASGAALAAGGQIGLPAEPSSAHHWLVDPE